MGLSSILIILCGKPIAVLTVISDATVRIAIILYYFIVKGSLAAYMLPMKRLLLEEPKEKSATLLIELFVFAGIMIWVIYLILEFIN